MCRFSVRAVVFLAFPVHRRFANFLVFPPRLVILGARHISEDRVVRNHVERVFVRFLVGPRYDAKVAGLWINRAQPTLVIEMQPGYVVTKRVDFPAGHRMRRNQHGEVGLAASRRECTGNVMCFPFGAFQSHDHHVLGEPAFFTSLVAGDAQRVAFLA